MDFSKEVVIIQRRLTDYREPLFNQMREMLLKKNIKLRLLYGQPTKLEASKGDSGSLSWAEQIDCQYFFKGKLCWQSFGRETQNSDLVIVTQENKLLYNLIALTFNRPKKIAFWGHGANLQSKKRNSIKELFKQWTTKKADWWFAYTSLSVDLIVRQGYPVEKITDLENSVDTAGLQNEFASIADAEVDLIRQQYGFDNQVVVGLYLGSLYEEKRIDFLISAANQIHAENPNFRLVVVGDGPLREMVKIASQQNDWLIYVGGKRGREKSIYLKLADCFLNPGMVGLGILDTFVAGKPIVTTDCGIHSPEVAYLQHGVNGIISKNTLKDYIEQVNKLISNKAYRESLGVAAKESIHRYSVENMASNFCEGILKVLCV